jgi:hypothetical protein
MTTTTPGPFPRPPLEPDARIKLRGYAEENLRRGLWRERFLSNEDTLALLDQVDALLARTLSPEELAALNDALDGYDAAIDRIEGEWGWMRSTEKLREDGDDEVLALDKARAVLARVNPDIATAGQIAGDR